jgi:transcriptional regulator of acetoin/glycerol metabolism
VVNDLDFLDSPDLLDSIFAYIEAEFPAMAAQLAELKEATRREFSGEKVWVNRRSALERKRLVNEVLRLFNGRNATVVARRLNIGRATVYRIIKQAGKK